MQSIGIYTNNIEIRRDMFTDISLTNIFRNNCEELMWARLIQFHDIITTFFKEWMILKGMWLKIAHTQTRCSCIRFNITISEWKILKI